MIEYLGVKAAVLYHEDAERANGVAEQLVSGSRERKPDEISKVQQVRTAPFTAHLDASERENGRCRRGKQKPKNNAKKANQTEAWHPTSNGDTLPRHASGWARE